MGDPPTLPNYERATKVRLHNLIRRFATDYASFIWSTKTLKSKITACGTVEQLTSNLIRGCRNMQFMSKEDHFNVVGRLGSGVFGDVDLVLLKSTNEPYALKSIKIPRQLNLHERYANLVTEKEIAEKCWNRRYVVKLIASWMENGHLTRPDTACLLFEYMPYGNLTNLADQLYPMSRMGIDRYGEAGYMTLQWPNRRTLNERYNRIMITEIEQNMIKQDYELTERYKKIIVTCMASIVDAINYLHYAEIIHQDLKPENILVDANMQVKISDFGLSSSFSPICDKRYFQWMNRNVKLSARVPELGDIPEQMDEFEADRRQIMTVPGGAYHENDYIPPELSVRQEFWDQYIGMDKPYIIARKHYPYDWYAVGLIIAFLCTGMHAVRDALGYHPIPHPSQINILLKLMRIKPVCNELLYGTMGHNQPLEVVAEKFWDSRLLIIIRGLTQPLPALRWTGYILTQNIPAYESLLTEYNSPGEPLFAWNEFIAEAHRTRPLGERLLRRFQDGLLPVTPSPGSPSLYHRLPETVIYSALHEPIDLVPAARESPRKRLFPPRGDHHSPPAPLQPSAAHHPEVIVISSDSDDDPSGNEEIIVV